MSHQSELIEKDILGYLKEHEEKALLRLLTCGSVDDGKSTLIGRLLHDSKMIYEDQLAAINADSRQSGTQGDRPDLALLVDGLQAEREQGITIDVAYRYFSTARRKFIIADTPGHEQYTRNMATGASTCDLAIILIDARYGVQTQTRRHTYIANLLGIRHLVVAINKMDLVDFSRERFEQIRNDYLDFAEKLNLGDVRFVPMSALEGDNVVNRSERTPWYTDSSLMEILETVQIDGDRNLSDFRFPVQYVNRPDLNFRGYAGTVASGVVKPGDAVTVLPSRKASTVKSIVTWEGEQDEAFAGQAVTLTLSDEIDISRGDTLALSDNLPDVHYALDAVVVWMAEQPLQPGRRYAIKLASTVVDGTVRDIEHRVDVNTLEKGNTDQLGLNEIGLCRLIMEKDVAFDRYRDNRTMGAFIIIDRMTHVTVGAGMIRGKTEVGEEALLPVSAQDRQVRLGHKPAWVVLPEDTDVKRLERSLFDRGYLPVVVEYSESGHWLESAQSLYSAGLIVLMVGVPMGLQSQVGPDDAIVASHSDLGKESLDDFILSQLQIE